LTVSALKKPDISLESDKRSILDYLNPQKTLLEIK
jgi:hypothetical protein